MVEVYDYDVASMEFSYVDGPFEVCDFDSISIGDEVGIVVSDEFIQEDVFMEFVVLRNTSFCSGKMRVVYGKILNTKNPDDYFEVELYMFSDSSRNAIRVMRAGPPVPVPGYPG